MLSFVWYEVSCFYFSWVILEFVVRKTTRELRLTLFWEKQYNKYLMKRQKIVESWILTKIVVCGVENYSTYFISNYLLYSAVFDFLLANSYFSRVNCITFFHSQCILQLYYTSKNWVAKNNTRHTRYYNWHTINENKLKLIHISV